MFAGRNLKFSYGSRVILDDVTLSLMSGERVALVGQNGMGKSTLLAILSGTKPTDFGFLDIASHVRVGVLQQVPTLDENLSVRETVRLGMAQLVHELEEHQRLCNKLEHVTDENELKKLHRQIDHLAKNIESKGGFDVDYQIERVLTKLGVLAREQTIETLSGGERRRVDLARLLLSAPDVYLLDEPTNHLDIGAIQFLADHFTKNRCTLLFVSHDRAFIDEVATRIVELDKGKLYTHDMPYANYLESKLVRELVDERSAHRRERLMAQEIAWLRAGTPARTTKQSARIERAEKLIAQVSDDVIRLKEKRVRLQMNQKSRLGNTVLELDRIGVSYGPQKNLFADLSLKVVPMERFGILGRNGCGKTSLLSIIAGRQEPSQGDIRYGKNTKVLEFDQHRSVLDPEASLKETLADHGDHVFIGDQKMHIASYLEKYLFSPSDMNRKVATLSGGEQNRLMLAKLFRQPANCLLLDEPTNDLDATTLSILEETLLDFEGVVFIVSHDRAFLDRVCTGIIAFEPSERKHGALSDVVVYQGDFTTYMRLKAEQEKKDAEAPVTTRAQEPVSVRAKSKRKRSYQEDREYTQIEAKIGTLEKEREHLQGIINQGEIFREDPKSAQAHLQRIKDLESEIEKSYARWQELEEIG